jgi:hypothetical protein
MYIFDKIPTFAQLHQKNLPIPEQTVQGHKSLYPLAHPTLDTMGTP